MSNLKPIVLHGHASGPNPWKIATIFEELGLPYEHKMHDMPDLKKEPFLSLSPNGRVPAIEDPNTGITLWESGAIAEYLIETYDKSHKISHGSSPEKFYEQQWSAFQISGQGPYFGQAVWFTRYHPEQLPSAKERYYKEMERVIGVIDLHLTKTGKQYLVGDKCTWADLMFLQWAAAPSRLGLDEQIFAGGKNAKYHEWLNKLSARPAVQKIAKDKAAAMEGH